MTSLRLTAAQTLGHGPEALAADLAYLTTAIVNVYFFGAPEAGDRGWVLIDAGMPFSAGAIAAAAAKRFGPEARPAAIVLTHGHFDHVGGVRELAALWDVPVYAHRLELPYLTGQSAYPPPDPSVGGGMMARMAWLYPRGPIDLRDRIHPLPDDGTVPHMRGWRWIHTPGHTAGHVSLFRESDRTLLAGDAFITVRQESALAVLSQQPEIHGPPAYYTTDWPAAGRSVERLAALEPRLAATGHGMPMRGKAMLEGLQRLARDFDRLAVPRRGRYVQQPAITDERGVVFLPPDVASPVQGLLVGLGAGAALGVVIGSMLVPGRRSSR